MLKDILIQDYPTIFQNSVVLLNGEPYYIVGFDAQWAECLNIKEQEFETLDFTKISDIKIPNTGYFNYRGVCCYISRFPCRKYKHGLSSENIRVMSEDVIDHVALVKMKDCKEQAMWLKTKSLYNMYKKQYPTLSEAVQKVKENGVYSVAFDRQFAVHKNRNVTYKTKIVGVCVGGKILLDSSYKHLRVALPKEYQ